MSASTLEKIFTAMQNSKGFPALENTVESVLAALKDSEKGHHELVDHVIEDFALTQRTLKLANSAMYAPFAKASSSVSSALDVLGTDGLLHIVLSTAMVSTTDLQNDESLSRTLLASELARSMVNERAEDVSIAALMVDLGRLLATRFLPHESAEIERSIAAGRASDQAALENLGLTFQQLGAEVAKRWNLPREITSIIDGTGDPMLIELAKFSNTAATLIHQGKAEEVQKLVADLSLTGVDKSRLLSLVSSKADMMATKAKLTPTVSVEAKLSDLLADLTNDKRASVEALASVMFAAFGDLLNTAHCLLFMLTRSGEYRVRYGSGKGIDELKSKLRISADFKPTAFHAVVKNNVDVSINEMSRLKSANLPDGYLELLPNVKKFIVLPIANSAVSGLIYCDWDSDRVLSQTEMELVKKLRDLLLPFFPA
jgi:HD-like signal output (HDOD) protein